MAKRITIRSVGRKMSYTVTGVCEACNSKYVISNTVDVGASTSHKGISNSSLVSMSKGRAERTYWDVLQNIFLEPRRLKVYKKCSECGHIQSWMRLTKEKPGFFSSLFEGGSSNSGSAGMIPTAPVFSQTDNFDISIHDYPPEVPFGMRAMEQACLLTCVKNSVPMHYVKYLGTKVYTDRNYKQTPAEFKQVRTEIEYHEALAKRRELNTNILKGRNTLFPFCIRMNGENWKNLARIVEDYHYGHVEEEDVMKLILPEDSGGISDEGLKDREILENYMKVDKAKRL